MTHCDRLLAALADRRWHGHRELYALGMIVHSRVADLRRKGYQVEQRRDGDDYLYRLAAVPEPPSPAPLLPRQATTARAWAVAEPPLSRGRGGGSGTATLVRDGVEQLVLGDPWA